MNQQFRTYTSKKRLSGMTLIELMISLTIGLILIAAVGYVYIGSRQSFRTQEALSRMQENARYAFETMSKDIRLASFGGCSYNTSVNVLNNPSDWYKNLFDQPLTGYEDTNSASVSAIPSQITDRVRGDVLTILLADPKEYIVDGPPNGHNVNSAVLRLTATHNIQPGEILVVTNCSHAAVFQMTNPTNTNNNAQTIVHNTGNSTPQGNCTKYFFNTTPASETQRCTTNVDEAQNFEHGRIFRLNAVTYYIRNNGDEEPSLYRERLTHNSGNATTQADELLQGVQDMQIVYGVDNTANDITSVNTYVPANSVSALSCGAATAPSAGWDCVLGVRIRLLMVSQRNKNITTQPQRYKLDKNGDGDVGDDGEIVDPNDRLLRKIFTATFAVRNRL